MWGSSTATWSVFVPQWGSTRVLLVVGGVALHQQSETLPGKRAEKQAYAEELLPGAGNLGKEGTNTA